MTTKSCRCNLCFVFIRPYLHLFSRLHHPQYGSLAPRHWLQSVYCSQSWTFTLLSFLSVITYTWSRFRSNNRSDLTLVAGAMGMSAYSIPLLADSTTAFLRLPSAVPRKATVKSPVEVAVTDVNRLSKVRTGDWVMGSSPPRGVLTSKPQNCSPIWVNLVLIHRKLKWMKIV